MKKINILKENRDFSRIIKNYKPFRYKDYIVYTENINDKLYHFGFSVGKKVGNAVIRNKIKRQLKSILDKKCYQNGFNCIIIVKKEIQFKKYEEMEKELFFILQKLKLFKEDKGGKK